VQLEWLFVEDQVCDPKFSDLVADPCKLVENLVENSGFRTGFWLERLVKCSPYLS